MKGTLIGIAVREKKRAPMHEITEATVSFDNGVEDDSRGKFKNHRQVTVVTQEAWEMVSKELNATLPWTFRRANLLVKGLDLENKTGGKLTIGDVELEITGELDPCNRMDEQHNGLTAALVHNWRGGVTCRIISEGRIQIDDKISLEN